MKTESHSINDVLAKNATSFFIPPFQRAYAWGKPEIDRYFDDLMRIIRSELDEKQHDKLEHFFGTIVIKEEKAGFANKSIVVDGQQRLTTTLLFLIALRDSEPDSAKQQFITDNYLTNNASTFQDKIKLKQVTRDWEAYKALVNKTPQKNGIIFNGYQYFSKLISERQRISPEIQFEHYISAIQKMNVAVIFLDERPFKGEDPQIIFETLNSLGKPLTLSDLVRNYVLLNMDSNTQTEIYENLWHPQIESILNESTSEFFRDYLQYKTVSQIKVVSDNNTKEVYHQFKDFVEGTFQNHKDFIDDIVRYVKWYTWIITEVFSDTISTSDTNNAKIRELLRNIFHDIKAEAFKPFVLGLLECHQCGIENVEMSDETLISILVSIRTYLIRRRILGLTQGENKNIVLLSNRIKDLAQNTVTMFDLLSNMFYRLRLPNDKEMGDFLKSMNFYEGLKTYSKFILGKIEEHNTKVAVDFRNPKITIEHIMPQKLDDDWINELGENATRIHSDYLHNIGNLILTEFNSEMGNKSFCIKKTELAKSSLHYRLDIIGRKTWTETDIQDHQNNMINWFLATFSLPSDFSVRNNWNTSTIESRTRFSPMDSDASDNAEGNKPSELRINGKTLKVKTWQDVFIEFIKYIKANADFDFDIILNNQNDLFGRADTIIYWNRLEQLIAANFDLSSRYKTFEGKSWDKVKDLNSTYLFIHVNISASTCVTRIANIMNKLNMLEDSVEIVLKGGVYSQSENKQEKDASVSNQLF